MQILEATPERRGNLQARGPGAALAPAHTVRMLRALGTRVRVHLRTKASPPHSRPSHVVTLFAKAQGGPGVGLAPHTLLPVPTAHATTPRVLTTASC